jgi:hypothetical protein
MDQIQDLVALCQSTLEVSQTLPSADQKILRSFIAKLQPIHTGFMKTTMGLRKIHAHVRELKVILNADETADQGESRLRDLSIRWRVHLSKHRKRLTVEEIQFIEHTLKYLRIKIPNLMNYRRVTGAPKTNNRHEQRYHRMKYKLRRIIGHVAAKDYLFRHGKSILFVNPDASKAEIKEILMNAPIAKIRKQIRDERKHRNSIEESIYDPEKWAAEMEKLKADFKPYQDLKKRLT